MILKRGQSGITLGMEDKILEFAEDAALQRLCEEVSKHLTSGTVLEFDFASSHTVGNKEVTDVNMTGLLATRSPTILFEKHGTLIVLVDDQVSHSVSLRLEKVLRP